MVSGEWSADAEAGGAGVGFKGGAEGGGGVMVIFPYGKVLWWQVFNLPVATLNTSKNEAVAEQ